MRLRCVMPALVALSCAVPAAARDVPTVSIVHSGLFERYCIAQFTPQPGTLAEIKARLPEFRQAWAAEGPALLAGASRLAGQPFRFAETVATLQGCTGVASMSAPLTIEAAPFTEAAAASEAAGSEDAAESRKTPGKVSPEPMSKFVYSLWHELMHRYVSDSIASLPTGTTPLLRAYASENIVTRNHLHLFAIESLLWRQLGGDRETAERIAAKRARRARHYVRAYEIVQAEGAEKFFAELRPR